LIFDLKGKGDVRCMEAFRNEGEGGFVICDF